MDEKNKNIIEIIEKYTYELNHIINKIENIKNHDKKYLKFDEYCNLKKLKIQITNNSSTIINNLLDNPCELYNKINLNYVKIYDYKLKINNKFLKKNNDDNFLNIFLSIYENIDDKDKSILKDFNNFNDNNLIFKEIINQLNNIKNFYFLIIIKDEISNLYIPFLIK